MIDQSWLEQIKKSFVSQPRKQYDFVFLPKNPQKKIVIRPIPYNGKLFKEVIKHYVGNQSLLCLKNWNKPCPLCEYVNNMNDNKTKIGAVSRYYMNVIVRRHDEDKSIILNDKVYILVSPISVVKGILKYMVDDEYLIPELLDPKKGYDIIIERTNDNKLSIDVARKPSSISIPSDVYDLDDIIPQFEEKHINSLVAVVNGMRNGQATQKTKPKECFGSYKGDSDCVVCPHEIDCIKETQSQG